MPSGPPPLQDPSSALEVTVGREHFRNGEVTLVVDGTGAMRVLQLRSGAEREWEGRLGAERVAELSEELGELDLRSVSARAGGRDPDDDPVRLVLRSGADAAHEAQLWHADRFEDQRLDRLLRRWQELTEEITDGALPYGEPA
jgi:rhodanese-related sulfurtransferase